MIKETKEKVDYEKDLDEILGSLKAMDLLKPEETSAILAEFNARMLAKIATYLENRSVDWVL